MVVAVDWIELIKYIYLQNTNNNRILHNQNISNMKQKLFHLGIGNYFDSNKEIVFPNNLQELINDGWYIKEMSAYNDSSNSGAAASGLTLLLQKD